MTNYNHKYAISLLGVSDTPLRSVKRRRRRRLYTRCLPAIALCWEALDYCCPERLHPRLIPLTEQLTLHGELLPNQEILAELARISRSTLARRLRELPSPKAPMLPRNRPRSLIKCDVPIGRYDWDESRPGALEADLLEHNGGTTSGQYAHTLTVTDIVTGWTRRRAIMGRGQARVHDALALLISQWPYPCWHLHADNGPEFLARQVKAFLANHTLPQTRSQPYRKNDNAHVEQRNRFLREMVGYDRYDNQAAVDWLNRIYDLLDPYANLVLPTMKLVHKERRGSKVKKTYDTPRPPVNRAFELGVVPEDERGQLESTVASVTQAESACPVDAR